MELPRRCLEAVGVTGRTVVLDPFSGSGTTWVAALRAGARYVGFEIDVEQAAASQQRLDGVLAGQRSAQRRLSARCARTTVRPVLGLPDGVRACLFDMDGVLTQTATVHAAAWKQMFDDFLRLRAGRTGEAFRAFDEAADYSAYVDGKPRGDGTRSFLASRGITLPEGAPDDPPDAQTVAGLGNRKNILVTEKIHTDGVAAYEGSVRYLHAVRAAGLKAAVVSSSANAAEVVAAAGLAELLDARVDGELGRSERLAGKPAPDYFLAAARLLGVEPAQAAVFEDALAGVEAGRAGGFGCVVGVNRTGQADELRAHGADLVVDDLEELVSGIRCPDTEYHSRGTS